jgi:hypothetical protein
MRQFTILSVGAQDVRLQALESLDPLDIHVVSKTRHANRLFLVYPVNLVTLDRAGSDADEILAVQFKGIRTVSVIVIHAGWKGFTAHQLILLFADRTSISIILNS